MSFLVEGASAVVTGASRGIGWAVARTLRARGVAVAMVARSRGPLEQAAPATSAAHRSQQTSEPGPTGMTGSGFVLERPADVVVKFMGMERS